MGSRQKREAAQDKANRIKRTGVRVESFVAHFIENFVENGRIPTKCSTMCAERNPDSPKVMGFDLV